MEKDKKVRCPIWLAPDIRQWMIERAEKEGRSVSGLGAFLLRGIKEQDEKAEK